MKKGYKIVRLSNGKLHSHVMCDNASVEYGIGRRTIPNRGCGPLCVFGTLKDAGEFVKNDSLYECDYEPSSDGTVHTNVAGSEFPLSELPDGTILANSITLTRKVL